MSGQSRFLPESVSGALRGICAKLCGFAVLIFAAWSIVALMFHDPYLDGVAAAGNFGTQSLMGNFVGVFRYAIGYVPTLFLFLCIARFGLILMSGAVRDGTPEYNILRGFVAICLGAAGFGLIAPRTTYGGMMGAIAAADISNLAGSVGAIVIGVLCLCGFFMIAGILLHISFADVIRIVRNVIGAVRWVLTAFHLMKPIEEEEEEEKPKPRRKPARRRAVSKSAEVIEYELPDPEFLEKSNFGKSVVTPELKQNARAMEIHFAEYGVNGHVVGIRPGPIVTLYEFKPDSGVRMVDINKTVKDMTRAMATENIRIAHIPRTELIGVEMVNLNRQTVRFQGLVADDAFVNSKYKIPLALGVDIGGNPMYFDLAKMPHVLIAGRTGSGKSVFVQSIIMSVLYHFTPDKCKLMIIDPKGVDFGFWDDIPHLITPIIKLDPNAAVNALKWSVQEMELRYKRLLDFGVQNIEAYNEAVAAKRAAGEVVTKQVAVGTNEETGELEYETQTVDLSDMAYLVIVIDEVADLMGVARKEVEACVQRLAQKARAAGIHLVMATQRPDATTITGVIKANFPTRISFQARSNIDSMTTLGEKGAENLLACGDMLFSEAGRVPVRIHGAFIEPAEMTRVADFLRAQGEPEYVSGVVDGEDGGAAAGGAVPGMPASTGDKDADLYAQAKEYVIKDKKPTISYIQRRLSVGYNKAAGFMERMEQEGIVSAPDPNGKRHIL
ncbi:MAG: DUF87 domain-containing protein [Alphaproteobacteria bacterium]|nr:DUF87 domain-containing protein [Alphaproteobacteria bacterium]